MAKADTSAAKRDRRLAKKKARKGVEQGKKKLVQAREKVIQAKQELQTKQDSSRSSDSSSAPERVSEECSYCHKEETTYRPTQEREVKMVREEKIKAPSAPFPPRPEHVPAESPVTKKVIKEELHKMRTEPTPYNASPVTAV